MGGFSEDNLLCIDQRGFKTIIQAEASEFLSTDQILLNSVVKNITYSNSGVEVTLVDGTTLSADYALVTFSVGVLQNDDVSFSPALPDWKQEAIQSITMVKYLYLLMDGIDINIHHRLLTQKYSSNSQKTSGLTRR